MKTIWFLIFVIFLVLPVAYSTDVGIIGQNTTLWATVNLDPSIVTASGAKISIYLPNGTVSEINSTMTLVTVNKFAYNYSPNASGNYYTEVFYETNTDLNITSADTFYVMEDSDMNIAIVLGYIAFLVFYAWFGVYLTTRQNQLPIFGESKHKIVQTFTIGDIGVLIIVSCLPLVTLLIGILSSMSQNAPYHGLIVTAYTVSWVFLMIVAPLFLIFYFFLRNVMHSLQSVQLQHRGGKK